MTEQLGLLNCVLMLPPWNIHRVAVMRLMMPHAFIIIGEATPLA
jgi:hypothetical protein